MLGVLLAAPQAQAYYDKTDYTEAYTILPNESAFWIPDAGANKDNQAQFDSEAYLQANKIAVKRFIVPHTKLQGSGGFFDFYVPAGRLIIVDRTPFSREWVEARERGTSTRNESFPCQSKEGLNISVGVSIGASVLEANAAKYLYRFGVLPPVGDRTDPKVIFASVFFSRKLSDVMDDVGRKKVQTLVCNEIASRSFDKANEEANQIMGAVGKAATDYFASVGITLDFIGWADTFTFDPAVQDAVNRRYVASQDQAIAAALAPYASTIQALARRTRCGRSATRVTAGCRPPSSACRPILAALLGTLLRSGAGAPMRCPRTQAALPCTEMSAMLCHCEARSAPNERQAAPPPLGEGVGGEGVVQPPAVAVRTPPPNPLPQGEGECPCRQRRCSPRGPNPLPQGEGECPSHDGLAVSFRAGRPAAAVNSR